MSSYPTAPSRLDVGGSGHQAPTLDPLRKGSTFMRALEIEGIDLTGHEARMSVKESYESVPEIFFSSTEVNTAKPRMTVEPADNNTPARITLISPAAFNETLDGGDSNCIPRRKKYWYDMELITPNGEVFAFLEGEFWILDELTTES